MRKDMAKVLVERSRTGGSRDRRGRAPRSLEDLPNKVSMKRGHNDRKSLNENLSPLKRFLDSRVGKPWDQVYSEISANLKPSNAVQQHVRDHIWDFVKKDVFIAEGGIVCGYNRYRYFGGNHEINNNQLYIDPETGILKKYKTTKNKRVKDPNQSFLVNLSYLHSHKCQLMIDENDQVFRLYPDPLTKEWTIKQRATADHAKLDFSERFVYESYGIRSFFKNYGRKIDLKHPYFKTYLELIWIRDEQLEKGRKSKEALKNQSPFKVGSEVEFSKDGGKTWTEGIVNRVETRKSPTALPPSYFSIWVTVKDKNIHISLYHKGYQVRLKK